MIILLINTVLALNPIIGILTLPSDEDYTPYPKSKYAYFASSYVKMIENAGARVLPIPYEAKQADLVQYFQQVNGILFTGGSLAFEDLGGQYINTVEYLLNLVIQANDAGDTFPIMATCLAHQAVHYILSGKKGDVLTAVKNERHVVQSLQEISQDGSIFKHLSTRVFNAAATEKIVYFNTGWGVTQQTYDKYPGLNFLRVTSWAKDVNGVRFSASTEAYKYPIFTQAYHPEKAQYEWTYAANRSLEAKQFAQTHANILVEYSRLNRHTYEKGQLIYDFQTVSIPQASFMAIYVFELGQLKI